MRDAGKQWAKPRLIVIGRGAPEESILLKCKHSQSAVPCDKPTNFVNTQS